MAEDEFDVQLLEAFGAGEVALFLGAGFALAPSSDGPSRDKVGLKDHLATAFRQSLRDAPHDLSALSMEDLVLYLESRAGVTRLTIEDAIRRFLAESSELASLESFTLLRRLVERRPDVLDTIITTNWDTGIETALEGLSVPTRVVSADDDVITIEHGHLTIYKIHGDIARTNPGLVISSADFDLFEKEHPLIVEQLRGALASRYIAVLGYSARDDNFRRLLRHLSYDLRGRFRGGWLVTPRLADREKLWISEVGLRHVASTSQPLLRSVVSFTTTDELGTSPLTDVTNGAPPKADRFTQASQLDELAAQVRELYALRDVWVVRPRSASLDANARVALATAHFLEKNGSDAGSLAVSTGKTVEYLARELHTGAFRNHMTISSTVAVLNTSGAFRDSTSIVDLLSSRFGINASTSRVLRLAGFASTPAAKAARKALGVLAGDVVRESVLADIVVSSARPLEWFGHKELGSTGVAGRTQPFDFLFDGDPSEIEKAFSDAGVVAIHHMIPLDENGEDVSHRLEAHLQLTSADVYRPDVESLRGAAASARQMVVLAASDHRKASAVRAVLAGRLCNTLIVDLELARDLAEGESPKR